MLTQLGQLVSVLSVLMEQLLEGLMNHFHPGAGCFLPRLSGDRIYLCLPERVSSTFQVQGFVLVVAIVEAAPGPFGHHALFAFLGSQILDQRIQALVLGQGRDLPVDDAPKVAILAVELILEAEIWVLKFIFLWVQRTLKSQLADVVSPIWTTGVLGGVALAGETSVGLRGIHYKKIIF